VPAVPSQVTGEGPPDAAACGGENGSPSTLTFASNVSATAFTWFAGMLTTPDMFTNERMRPAAMRQSESRVNTSRWSSFERMPASSPVLSSNQSWRVPTGRPAPARSGGFTSSTV
jgi:hypothetical protein